MYSRLRSPSYRTVNIFILLIYTVMIIQLLFLPSLQVPTKQFCPPDWILVKTNNKCVFASRDYRGPFSENELLCEQRNSSMLVINSSEENEEIRQSLSKMAISRFWIGAKTSRKYGDSGNMSIEWKSSRIDDYYAWEPEGFPSCQSGPECCVIVNSRSLWQDVDCDLKVFLVCQKDSIYGSMEAIKFTPNQSEDNDVIDSDCLPKAFEMLLDPDRSIDLNKTQINETLSKIVKLIETKSSSSSIASTPNVTDLTPLQASSATTTAPVRVEVSEEIVDHIIKRYQKDQLEVIRQWFTLTNNRRNTSRSTEHLKDLKESETRETLKLFNYLIVILTGSLILTLIAVIVGLLICNRPALQRVNREKLIDSSRMSSHYINLNYD